MQTSERLLSYVTFFLVLLENICYLKSNQEDQHIYCILILYYILLYVILYYIILYYISKLLHVMVSKNHFQLAISMVERIIYRVSQEECARIRKSVPYVKVYRYDPKHLYPKLNGYGDNGQRSLKL